MIRKLFFFALLFNFFVWATGESSLVYAKKFAIVVGVSETNALGRDSYFYNDANEIAKTLENAGFEVFKCYAKQKDANDSGQKAATDSSSTETGSTETDSTETGSTETGSKSSKKNQIPTKANVEKLLETVLSSGRLAPGDVVLVYLSCHGKGKLVKEKNDKNEIEEKKRTLLALSDSDLNKEASFLSVKQILDKLDACVATKRILILDACHASGVRGPSPSSAENFEEIQQSETLVFAGSKFDQKSQRHPERAISLFTFFFNLALKGYADDNGDDILSTQEINDYIDRQLKEWGENYSQATRNGGDLVLWPQDSRLLASSNAKHFDLLEVEPCDVSTVLDEFADQIASRADLFKTNALVFNDFSATTQAKLLDVRKQNGLSNVRRFSSERLKNCLEQKANDVQIVDSSPDLKSGFAILENSIVFSEQEKESKSDRKKGGDVYLLKSELKLPGQGSFSIVRKVYAAQTRQTFFDSPTATAVALNSKTRPQPKISDSKPTIPQIYFEVKLDGESDDSFKRRDLIDVADALYLPLDDGEVYRVCCQKSDDREIGMRLLVDGRNSLPQYPPYIAPRPEIVLPLEASDATNDGTLKINDGTLKINDGTLKINDDSTQKSDETTKMIVVGPAEQPGGSENESNDVRETPSSPESSNDEFDFSESSDQNENSEYSNSNDRSEPDSPVAPTPNDEASSESEPRKLTFMPPVMLDDARFWILGKPGLRRYEGFYWDRERPGDVEQTVENDAEKTDFHCREFKVVDSARYFENLQDYNPDDFKKIGTIQIAFYKLAVVRGPFDPDNLTVPGEAKKRPVFINSGYKIDDEPFYQLQIRYASRRAIENDSNSSSNQKSDAISR